MRSHRSRWSPPLVMVALDRRRFITPIGPAERRPVRGERPRRGSARPYPTASPMPRSSPGVRHSAGRPGRPGRPACHSSTGRSPPSNARSSRRSSAGDHDLFIGRVDSMANVEPHRDCRCSTTGAATCTSRAPKAPRSKACRNTRSCSRMPTIRANDLDIGYDVHGAGPPLVMLHGATSIGREDFAAQIPLLSKAFQSTCPTRAATAGRAGTPQRVPLRLAGRGPRGVRRRARARYLPPARLLDGRDDRAPVRGRRRSGCGRWSSSGSRPSASRAPASPGG